MKIAYLASQLTLPDSSERRFDAFEHDEMMNALKPSFNKNDLTIMDIAWDDKQVNWSEFDAAIVGTTWDYCDRFEEFIATIESINCMIPVLNSPGIIKWNADKTYLKELEIKGASLIPTVWLDQPSKDGIKQSFKILESKEVVIKQQIGANAEGQYRLEIDDNIPDLSKPIMIQPFVRSIVEEGEYSFIFVGEEFSHSLLKTPCKGDYRIQSTYGGKEQKITPTDTDLRSAKSVLDLIDEQTLYSRVDMIRGEEGHLLLMEIELIEPYLYPKQGEDFGDMMALKIHDFMK